MRTTALTTTFLAALATITTVTATPLLHHHRRQGGLPVSSPQELAVIIEQIMPASKSCEGVTLAAEDCRTAAQAAPFILKSYSNTTVGELASVLALMGVESGDFRFKHNVFPGRPGQGTANMMMPNFVTEYATDLFGAEAVAGRGLNEVLALVTPDEFNFGSAGWFIRKHCDAGVQAAVRTGTDEGFAAYMGCVGVPADDASRVEYWNRAKSAFGLGGPVVEV